MKLVSQSLEDKNPTAFAKLFSVDSIFYLSPFNPAKNGREEIKSLAEKLFQDQSDFKFNYEILFLENNAGVCRWWCRYTSIHTKNLAKFEGIFFCCFDNNKLCNS
ncbi:MAG TPA: nuclear transport factor 2 family protein, partial [Ignavibacteriaceae bacterium]|nr:nuclear transport factor 2 family protein [Ignavibacteriaceae bacterium]